MNEQSGGKHLKGLLRLAPDGRQIVHWSGVDRQRDIAALIAAIADRGELYNQGGRIVRFNGGGGPTGVNRVGLQGFITEHLCAERLVCRDGKWLRECYDWAFVNKPRLPFPTAENPQPSHGPETEPDAVVLDELYRTELLKWLPRAE